MPICPGAASAILLRPMLVHGALAPRSLRLRRDQIHAAVTALVESGIKPSAIRRSPIWSRPTTSSASCAGASIASSGAENTFNRALGHALIQIAHEWVKVDAQVFAELKRLIGKMPAPVMGLTDKNKRALRQFDDPAVLRRLYALPERLWIEARRDKKPNFRTLAKAQAALAIAILCYMPLRLQNLAALEFDTHLFMREGRARDLNIGVASRRGEKRDGACVRYSASLSPRC